MARPLKHGLDYYPQDADIHSDRRMRRLLNEFGPTGYLVFEYIKSLAYKENGCWIKLDDDTVFDITDFLKCGITVSCVNEVISGCIRFGLFDADLYSVSGILTSADMQERYVKAKKKPVIPDEIRVIPYETPVKDDISTQSKVKESKEKESKEKESKEKEINTSLQEDTDSSDLENGEEQPDLITLKKEAFKKQLVPFLPIYGNELCNDFWYYWTEPNKANTKVRHEFEKVFDINARLRTFRKNKRMT